MRYLGKHCKRERDMGDWLVKVLVIAVLAWVLWCILQPRFLVEIRIQDGQPQVRKGKVTSAFLGRLAEECQEAGVRRGWVAALRRGRRLALRFSRDFPPGLQQRLRNEWQLCG